MKRDMDLIRIILLSVEQNHANKFLSDYDEDTIKYHKALCIEADLVEGAILPSGTGNREIPSAVMIKKLTWSGHDFIDAIASDTNWTKVKDFLKDGGKQLTIETVKAAVIQLFGL